jgi:glycosyltransferase involved in cell wall biosynthesis
MRVLLTGHFALDAWPLGWWMRDIGQALQRAGHEVRGLVASGEEAGDDPFPTARVVCRAGDAGADVDFAPPCFASEGGSSTTFETLSDEQISRYRDAWRRRLDHEVDRFDPHVIHAGHLWWDAQLALETGVPFVVSAWSAELTACADQPQARIHAQQAAENASRIFVPHRALGEAVQAAFGIVPDHITVLPPAIDWDGQKTGTAPASRAQLLKRFNLPPDSGPIVVARATPGADSGLDVLINAAARCQAASSTDLATSWPLTIIAGSGHPDPAWAAQAERLQFDRLRSIQVGHSAEWIQLLHAADLAVFPQREPADGLDVLWALGTGTPTILTEVCGLNWLAGYPAVRTIADGDHELLADAMIEALGGSWKTTAGKAGKDFVRRHHAIDAMAAQVAQAYRSVLIERFGRLPPE